MSKFFLLFCFSLCLSGCFHHEPQIFGIPQSLWVTLSEAERVQVIDGYNRKNAIKEANRPAEAAIAATKTLLNPIVNDKKYKY